MSYAQENQAEMRRMVEAASGGQMTVRYTTRGQASYFYRLRRSVFESTVESALSTNHPAFIIDGVQKDEILVGAHQAAEVDSEAVSQAGRMPRVDIDHDEAVELMRATGPGFFVCTTPVYAALALMARAENSYPRGNNNDGRAWNAPDEFGVDADGNPTSGGGAEAILAGSGPVEWNLPRTPFGVQNLNGNVWEWAPGQRTVDGEIQIIADNDAALVDADLSGDGPWQAIDADTGDLVSPGTSGAVKYATSGTAAGTLVCGSGDAFSSMTAHGVSAEALTVLKKYGLMNPGGITTVDGFYLSTVGERLPYRGGNWGFGSRAGVFALSLGSGRSSSDSGLGFRPAFAI